MARMVCIWLVLFGCGSNRSGNPAKPDGNEDGGIVPYCPESLVCNGDVAQWCEHGVLREVDCAEGQLVCVAGMGCRSCRPGGTCCGNSFWVDDPCGSPVERDEVLVCDADGRSATWVKTCDVAAGEICVMEDDQASCRDSCDVAADNPSSEGCEFYGVDLDNYAGDEGNPAAQQFAIILTNTSRASAEVTIEINHALPGDEPDLEVIRSFVIGPGCPYTVDDLDPREVDGSPPGTFDTGTDTALSSRAYRIRSTVPLTAYQFNPYQRFDTFSNDASLLLPTSAVGSVGSDVPPGSSYVVMGWPQLLADTEDPETDAGVDLRSTLTIVGTAAETTVMVQTSADILGSPDVPATPAGGLLSVNLEPFDVLNLETDGFGADFSGTRIDSDRPVMAFSGNECGDVPEYSGRFSRQCCCDHLEEQLFPLSSMGTAFVAVKTPSRTQALADAGARITPLPSETDHFRLLTTADHTTCKTSLPPPLDEFPLVAGSTRTVGAAEDFVIECSEPVVVAQFVASQWTVVGPDNEDLPAGDPSFILLPPVEQFRTEYRFSVPGKYVFDYLLIAAPSSTDVELRTIEAKEDCERTPVGTLTIDGRAVDFDAIRCALSQPVIAPGLPRPVNVDQGVQRDGLQWLRANAPVGLVLYGFDYSVSYGLPGGAKVAPINVQ